MRVAKGVRQGRRRQARRGPNRSHLDLALNQNPLRIAILDASQVPLPSLEGEIKLVVCHGIHLFVMKNLWYLWADGPKVAESDLKDAPNIQDHLRTSWTNALRCKQLFWSVLLLLERRPAGWMEGVKYP